ncbi:voltage-dependent calcium channel gamma-1 subunit [Plakobranchus ocellatus]|uniref:Voltage-dependent calcium channel gamma-1 subunit n=1 Tax=Plakobranchus ocellatus TaxID=259542 RepID=A0AAV3YHL2_9GAST|nr:voltage-dependent calcium channel gamma-1 subunit [Plakobranchus ocellatus]
MLLRIIAVIKKCVFFLTRGVGGAMDSGPTLITAGTFFRGIESRCLHPGLTKGLKHEITLLRTGYESCEPHNLFPSSEDFQKSTEYERHHLDYTRTAIAFTIIALVIMVIGHAFAFYALRRPRYIIKRLAALLHFMTAACLLVLNEVFVKTVEHEREKMPERIPRDAHTHYGFSFVLSWLVFVIFVLAGLIFLFTSHKKKAEYADGTEALEDEPMEIRR